MELHADGSRHVGHCHGPAAGDIDDTGDVGPARDHRQRIRHVLDVREIAYLRSRRQGTALRRQKRPNHGRHHPRFGLAWTIHLEEARVHGRPAAFGGRPAVIIHAACLQAAYSVPGLSALVSVSESSTGWYCAQVPIITKRRQVVRVSDFRNDAVATTESRFSMPC